MTLSARIEEYSEQTGNQLPDTVLLTFDELWRSLTQRRLRIVSAEQRDGECLCVIEPVSRPYPALSHTTVAVTQRVLCGECPKAIADSLRIGVSTISQQCAGVLRAMGALQTPTKVSILLVQAALAATGAEFEPARCRLLDGTSGRRLIRTTAPGVSFRPRLTHSEFAVVCLTIESKSYAQIAALRRTSERTVANQLAAAFRKLDCSGQSQLRAKAVLELARSPQLSEDSAARSGLAPVTLSQRARHARRPGDNGQLDRTVLG